MKHYEKYGKCPKCHGRQMEDDISFGGSIVFRSCLRCGYKFSQIALDSTLADVKREIGLKHVDLKYDAEEK